MFKKLLILLFIMALCLAAALPVLCAESSAGFAFPANSVYLIDKMPDRTPNTMEAEILLPRGYSSRSGVLIGSYSAENSINFELHKNGHPRIYWIGDDLEAHDCIFDKVNAATGTWVRLALVRDTEKGEARCYLDGNLAQTIPFEDHTDGTIKLGRFVLGGDMRSANTQSFKGRMRSLCLYSDIRTEEELADGSLAPSADALMFFDLTGAEGRPDLFPDLTGNGYDARYDVFWMPTADEPTGYSHSIAVIGDTQIVALKYPDNLPRIYDWIIENRERRKISCVIGLGDITDKSTDAEWEAARDSIFRLNGVLPYILCRGNHDTNATFEKTFLGTAYEKQLSGRSTPLGNACQLLDAGDQRYLILTLDYGPTDAALAWAASQIKKNPDRKVIVATHGYLTYDEGHLDYEDKYTPSKSPTSARNNGQEIWEKFVSRHKEIFLVLCGHISSNRVLTVRRTGVNGNLVTELLSDGQGVDSAVPGGAGLITMLYFSEDGRSIDLRYYSPIRDQYYMTGNQRTISLAADGESPRQEETAPSPEEETVPSLPAETEPDSVSGPDAAQPKNSGALWSIGIGAAVICLVLLLLFFRKKRK